MKQMVRSKKMNSIQTEDEFWADKFMDLANLEVVVLVFGQFITTNIHWGGIAVGIMVYIILAAVARWLRKKR